VVRYYGENGGGAHLPFNFQLIELPWDAREIARAIDAYEDALPPGAWPNWVLGNHDRSRIASRVGPQQARVAAMLLFTLRGTPTLYYGEEIGMRDVAILPGRVQDPWEINIPGLGLGRDPERTPMQWDSTSNAGFTAGRPWLPLADDFAQVNVAVQKKDPVSMLSLHRRLIKLRRAEPALELGDYALHHVDDRVLAYHRTLGDRRLLVALNLSAVPTSLEIGTDPARSILLSTHCDRSDHQIGTELALRPDEGVVLE
jgi:alpha-glucosidase